MLPLPGNASSLEDEKALHCFAAFHSSCLKVPASKREEDIFHLFIYLFILPLSPCMHFVFATSRACMSDKTESNKYAVPLATLQMQILPEGGKWSLSQLTFSCIVGGVVSVLMPTL